MGGGGGGGGGLIGMGFFSDFFKHKIFSRLYKRTFIRIWPEHMYKTVYHHERFDKTALQDRLMTLYADQAEGHTVPYTSDILGIFILLRSLILLLFCRVGVSQSLTAQRNAGVRNCTCPSASCDCQWNIRLGAIALAELLDVASSHQVDAILHHYHGLAPQTCICQSA